MISLLARLGLDGSQFLHGLSAATAAANKAGEKISDNLAGRITNKLAGLFGAGAIAAGLGNLVRTAIEAGKEISELSDQLDLGVDDIQRLQIAANRSGLEFDAFARALEKISELRAKALGGDAKANNLFSAFGVPSATLRGDATNLDLLKQIGDHIARVGVTSAESGELLELLGRHGERLVTALEKLRTLGPVQLISQSDIDASRQLAESFEEIHRQQKIAMAPYVSLLSRVVKNAQLGSTLNPFVAQRNLAFSVLGELMTPGRPLPSGPITEEETRTARARLNIDAAKAARGNVGIGEGRQQFASLAPVGASGLTRIGLLLSPGGAQGDAQRRTLELQQQQLIELRNLSALMRRGL